MARFDVAQTRLLTPREVAEVTSPWVGKELTLAELQGVAGRLTQLMHAKGYFVADAVLPAQRLGDGVVRISIFEGVLGELKVEGNKHYSDYFLKRRFMAQLDGNPLHQGRIQRALMLLNELPDLKVRAYLSPGKKEGTTDVVLKVEDTYPVHLGLGYDNFGSRNTSEHRTLVTIEDTNLTGRGDDLIVQNVIGMSRKGSDFVQAAYTFPLNAVGTRLGLSYSNGVYTVGQKLAILDIRGLASIYGATFTHPLLRTMTNSQDLSFGVSYKDTGNYFGRFTNSHDRYWSTRLGWQGMWSDLSGRTLLNVSATHGLSDFSSKRAKRLVSRRGAVGDFTHVNADAARVQNLGRDVYLILRGQVQTTGDTMLVSEAYSLGGPDSVRGYSQGQLLGDSGYLVSGELRVSPFSAIRDELQIAIFGDHGGTHINRPQFGEKVHQFLTGAGIGLRLAPSKNVTARFDLGFPISPSKVAGGTNPVLYGQFNLRF